MGCHVRNDSNVWGHLFLILVIGASTFYSVNGIRLIFTHSGQGLGKPGRHDYPYEPASINNRQRSGIWTAFVLTAVTMFMKQMFFLVESELQNNDFCKY